MARLALRIVAIPVVLIFLTVAHAQVTSVTGELTLPIPGAGHDYIHMLNETVNPVNGAVDIRISVPVPPGRGVTIPFSFGYDSNAAHHFIPGASGDPLDNASYLGAGGWSYVMPYLTMVQHVNTVEYSTSPPQFSHCYYYTDFLFTSLQGSSNLLGLSTSEQNGPGVCVPGNNGYSNWLAGTGESFESAAADGSTTQYPTAVTVSELDGTVYHFSNTYPGRVHPSANNTGWASLPDWVEDRNGNKTTISDSGGGAFTITDTAGRLLSSSGFKATGNTITVSGLATPYQITWGQATSNTAYGTKLYYSGAGGACTPAPGAPDGTFPEITQIKLPNGQSYQFQYAANAGLISKIIYPSGGYVRYAWGKNLLSDEMDFLDNVQTNTSPNCHEEYDTQAVTDRYVSYDGVTEVLHQHFTYTTNWNTAGNWPHWTTKNTSVTTYDLVRGTNFQTVYNYTPSQFFGSSQPNDPVTYSGNNIPVESSIVYYGTSGARLKTISKGYVSPTLPPDETVVLDNNQTSQTTHTYLSEYTIPPQPCSVGSCAHGAALAVPSDEYEYDYGAGSPGNLLRHTHTDYGPSGQTPIGGVLELPSDTITYDGGGVRAAEVDYSYDQTPVTPVSSLTGHDETNFPSSYQSPRGNLTSKTVQCIGCTNAVTTYTYDETGQVLSITDPCGNSACSDMSGTNHTTSYAYTDNYAAGSGTPPGTTNAFVTTITYPTVNGVTQHKYFQYAYSDGQLTQSQDENQKTAGLFTSYAYNDSLRRLTETDYPDGGQKLTVYNDTAPSPTLTTCSNINGAASATCSAISPPTGWIVNLATMDGMGQVVQTQLASDPEGSDSTDTVHDGMGLVYTQSNPHRSSSSTTDGTATYTYDAMGRTTNVLEPDGSSVTTSYSGNQTTVTDEAGSQRTSATDGIGRLVQVLEDPGVSPHLNYETDYTYDALNNLLSVTQKGGTTTSSQWRTRTFTYDSISQLLCAANPEIKNVTCPASAPFPFGALTYTYDADGNLATKTAPSPNQPSTGTATVTTNYAYDALNRITGKTYADTYANPATSPVLYGYDGKAITGCPADTPPSNTDTYPKGRRTSMCDGAEAATWTHDIMGRNRQESRSIAAIIGQHDNDTYNLDGSVATATSLGYAVQYSYSGAGRQIYLVGTNIYVQNNSATYAPFGGLTSAKLGQQPITITNAYNNRLQPLLISAAGATSVLSLCYDFHSKTSVTSGPCSFSASTVGDNGNVFQIVNNRDNNRTQNFLYDPLNRISQAYSSGPNWGETYGPTATNPGVQPTSSGIDAWGNLTNRSGVTGKSNTEGWSCLATNQNQIGSCSIIYDPAGNTIKNGSITYTYDAENRLIATQGMSYLYDGDGKRVEKCTQGTTPGTCATGATGTLYWTGPGSNTLAETDLAGNVLENYIFFNGQRIARREPGTPATIHFYFSDHLGSHGVVTNNTGSACEQDIDYYPYGGVEQDYCPTVAQHFKFTGKERDTESGLDNFGARYNASTLGRFMTPDWSASPQALPYGELSNPQGLNRYAYTRNNPTSFTDPDGHCTIDGEKHGFWWCFGHALGVKETQQEQINDARNFFKNNPLFHNGKRIDPSKLTDKQVLQAFRDFNTQQERISFENGGINPMGAFQLGLFPDAEKIADGHSWSKHQQEFPGWSYDDFEAAVEQTVQNPDEVKQLSNGRTAYWNDKEQMVVIHDPNSPDGGTAFRPTNGKAYFDSPSLN